MREIRPSGSEGGGTGVTRSSLPLSRARVELPVTESRPFRAWRSDSVVTQGWRPGLLNLAHFRADEATPSPLGPFFENKSGLFLQMGFGVKTLVDLAVRSCLPNS